MPTVCPQCGKPVSEKLSACYSCGAVLVSAVVCADCGKENPGSRATCLYCGKRLGKRPPQQALAGLAVPPPPAAPPPAPQPVQQEEAAADVQKAPAQPAAGSLSAETNATIDRMLSLLALPVWLFGFAVIVLVILLGMVASLFTKGERLRGFSRGAMNISTLLSPQPVHYIVASIVSLVATMCISGFSKADSPFMIRHAFWLMAASAVAGFVLGCRRWSRKFR